MANANPNFVFGFFWMGSNTKRKLWMDMWMLTEETLEIWYQDDKGWPNLLSKRRGEVDDGDEHDEHEVDNLYESMNLTRSIPDANATALDPIDIRNSTHLRT